MAKKVDFLFTNAHVICMDDNFTRYENGAVAVSGDQIKAVGDSEELKKVFQANEVIDCGGKVLMPGCLASGIHHACGKGICQPGICKAGNLSCLC